MMVRERVAAVVEELKRLKREGVAAVAVSDDTLSALRTAVARTARPAAASSDRTEGATSHPALSGARSPANAASDTVNLLAVVNAAAPPASRATPAPGGGAFPAAPTVNLPDGAKRERWEWLRRRVLECPVCRAHTHGDHRVVFGVGNIDANIFFCGEAPGGEEEIQGEPFVGPAGQLLNKMIVAMGLKREDVYIGNILNWRPEMEGRRSGQTVRQTGNRAPTEEEMKFCLPYLRAQLEVVQPKVVVALGKTAAEGLLGFGSFSSLGSIRGRWLEYLGTPLMVTYHPSYLLRNVDNRTKRLVWEDLLKVMERVGLPISEKQRGFFR
jgi:uracil-DNA glycosylase